MSDDAVAEIDLDLEAACAHRTMTWRRLAFRDDKANRAAFDEATAHVDELLDMRNEMIAAEKMVTT